MVAILRTGRPGAALARRAADIGGSAGTAGNQQLGARLGVVFVIVCAGLCVLSAGREIARRTDSKSVPRGAAGTWRDELAQDVDAAARSLASESTTPASKPLAYYTQFVAGALFEEATPPAMPAPAPAPKRPSVPRAKPAAPPPPPDPFGDWIYTGTIRFSDDTLALLENQETAEGQYVRLGDAFLGATVEAVNDREVVLNTAGRHSRLPKSTVIILVPLDRSATNPASPQAAQAVGAALDATDVRTGRRGIEPGGGALPGGGFGGPPGGPPPGGFGGPGGPPPGGGPGGLGPPDFGPGGPGGPGGGPPGP